MKKHPRKRVLPLLLASGMVAALSAGNSYACAVEPFLSSVCIMAASGSQFQSGFNGTYLAAAGQTLPLNTYTALFSLVGTTYGGNGSTNFMLPDLRGRVVVGSGTGPGLPAFPIGSNGGATAITINVSNLPAHSHTLTTGAGGVTVTAGLGTLVANTTMTGLTATTTMAGVTGKVAGSDLTLNASSSGSSTGSPSGAALASTGLTKIYNNSSAPNVTMASGSIGGAAPVTFNGNPTTTITGNPTTTLTGAPLVTVGGMTGVTGSNTPINNMPPYLVLNYYIAVQGAYPSPN